MLDFGLNACGFVECGNDFFVVKDLCLGERHFEFLAIFEPFSCWLIAPNPERPSLQGDRLKVLIVVDPNSSYICVGQPKAAVLFGHGMGDLVVPFSHQMDGEVIGRFGFE